MRYARAGLAALALLLTTLSASLRAEVVKYTWSGLVKPSFEATSDPWGVGVEGKPFTVSAFLDPDAVDESDAIESARFRTDLSVSFLLEGVPGTVLDSDRLAIHFDDDVESFHPPRDLLKIRFDVEFNGAVEPMVPVAFLSDSAFSFTLQQERPPLFGTVTHPDDGRSSVDGGNYLTWIYAGTPVTSVVVAEPSSFTLLGIGAVGLLAYGFRRKRAVKRGRESFAGVGVNS